MQFSLRALWLLMIGIAAWLAFSVSYPTSGSCLSVVALQMGWCYLMYTRWPRVRGWEAAFWAGNAVTLPLHLILGVILFLFGVMNFFITMRLDEQVLLLSTFLRLGVAVGILTLLAGLMGILAWGLVRFLISLEED